MEILIKIIYLIMSLSILVFLHEMGHYLTARWFKIRVDKFYLFFDFLFPLQNVLKFSIFKKKIGDTEWGIGYGKFTAGGMDESPLIDKLPIGNGMEDSPSAKTRATEAFIWQIYQEAITKNKTEILK